MHKMLRILSVFLLLQMVLQGSLMPAPLSDSARISVLTCSPGQETYSLFGHTAIRVTDPAQDIELVFNYGTFDFNTPNFYMQFLKGRLNYMLSVTSFEQFLIEYINENRSVFEQELLISHPEKEILFTNLLENYRPENRYYLYDFFYDNCATRVRDIIAHSLDSEVHYDYSDYREELTFRQLLDPYLAASPWLDLGIDLALGLPADRKAVPWEYMFLPDYILEIYDKAMLDSGNGSRSLVSRMKIIHQAKESAEKPVLPLPGQVFWGLFLLSFLMAGFEWKKHSRLVWFDRLLFLVLGLLGALLLSLWIISDHIPLAANLNLLWALPTHLVAIFFIRHGKNPFWLQVYFLVSAIPVAGLLLALPWIHTYLPSPLLPVLLTILVRLLMQSRLAEKWTAGK